MKRTKVSKPYWEMNARELAEATKEFDKPLPASRFKPLSRKERERFERARRAGGPDVHRIHAFDIDPKLINDVTAYARRNKMTLSQVVERGLRGVLAFEA